MSAAGTRVTDPIFVVLVSPCRHGSQANIAKPHFREGHEIGGDNDIRISGGGFEANLDFLSPSNFVIAAIASRRRSAALVYPHKRSHLVALQRTKISASNVVLVAGRAVITRL
jgi:hypothetical protein